MDAARYARVRELFLAAEELPADQQDAFLSDQAGDDPHLIQEVKSLLAEHDPESAQKEGATAKPPGPPLVSASPALPTSIGRGGSPTPRGISSSHQQTTQRGGGGGAQITQHGAQRTHASPRYADESTKRRSQTKPVFWDQQTKRNRRWNSGWLWIAAVLPTALMGWYTYAKVVSSLKNAVSKELAGVVNSVTISTKSFLDDRSQLVESWSRQPAIRHAVIELVEIGRQRDATEALRQAEQSDLIKKQLQELSGVKEVKFVVWNREGTILASWLDSRADVGNQVAPSGAANLVRVFRGERVLFGPERLTDTGNGFIPETDAPVMANMVPIRDERGDIVAALLVRGINTFDQFDKLFSEASRADGLDVYAVDRRGVMVTRSPMASALASRVSLDLSAEEFAAVMRVSDPGMEIGPENIGTIQRHALPLTLSAAGATTGRSNERIEPYNNYAGVPVIGAWRWNSDWQLGIIVEREYEVAYAAARIVRFGFLLLAAVLTITALAAASQIAKQSARVHAAIHPLGRYDVVGELGSGGMGVVIRARHRQLGRDVALKVLRDDRQHREDRLRFDREARLAASLSNPHSVTIYDYGRSEDGEAYCVMEFLHGITLYEVVTRDGPQPFGRVLFILRQICASLDEAHKLGLLHRDIKPQNVMLSLDPSVGDWAVVFDFGLAKSVNPEVGAYQTAETVWAGTPMYMAPERYREPAGMDPRSDIYSIGCIAYFLISGRPPYIECDPESLFALVLSEEPISMSVHRDQAVPQELVQLVGKCMAKHADNRFATVEELSAEVDRLRDEHPWTADEARGWWKIHGEDVLVQEQSDLVEQAT